MAENTNNTADIETHSFNEGMVKSVTGILSKKGSYFHARNAVRNSHDGELGVIGNEPANKLCIETKYPIIASCSLQDDKWVLFSTDDTNSEIGIFDESECSYKLIASQASLGFKRKNLITCVAKKNHDCTYSVYWVDAGNPDRMMNLDKPPYTKQEGSGLVNDCDIKYTPVIDIEKLRISQIVTVPSIHLEKGKSAGTLLNGTYQCVIAYLVNGIRVTDYFLPSNPQSLFSHQNSSGSLELFIDSIDTNFDEFELVVISNINRQASTKKVGIYSTRQNTVLVDYIDQTLVTIPLGDIMVKTPAYDQSDNMVAVNDYLLRIGVKTKPDFNYQLQANKILPKWVAIELPANYYSKGGNLTSYQRDEQQPFLIRWVYNSGKTSADYPITGRRATTIDRAPITGDDVYELQDTENERVIQRWEVENTASITSLTQYNLNEGRVIAEGLMGYWESSEKYPQKPAVWGDLCGQPILHSKFPDNQLVPHVKDNGEKIVILGVKFEGITHPLDMDGIPIPDIIGYQILKANREGHKTIIAKGMINNVGTYDIPEDISDKQGIYPNYPYNDLRTDPFLSKNIVRGGCQGKGYSEMGEFRDDVFTFHSPDTQFHHPYLSSSELKVYAEMTGVVTGGYEPVYKHPRHKLVRDFSLVVSGLVGVGEGLLAVKGRKTTTIEGPKAINIGNAGVVNTIPMGAAITAFYAGQIGVDEAVDTISTLDPTGTIDKIKLKTELLAGTTLFGTLPGTISSGQNTTTEDTAVSGLPTALKIISGAFLFSYYFSSGTQKTLEIIKKIVPYQQYAMQYNSHGLYNNLQGVTSGNRRRKINNAEYLEPYVQEFSDKYHVNNLFRSRQVILETAKELMRPKQIDNTRQSIGDLKMWTDSKRQFTSSTSAYYAALKIPMANQFGQVESLISIPISTGVLATVADKTMLFTSDVLFGGDIYINRYTEKNTFFYFNDWMYDVQDATEWNYNDHYNIPNPRYWINTREYDISQLTSALVKLNFKDDVLPNDLAHLDRDSRDCKTKVSFVINNAYFYLFNSGVRDFFVESEINIAQRDYGERDSQKHYDPYSNTDLKSLFRSDIIKEGNYFAYDFSLSVSKLLLNTASWGSQVPHDYDPFNQKCFSYYPNRVIYSLQQNEELKKDNWLVYLANNYKDFANKITTIQPVNATGAMILFESSSPVMFNGVDQLNTEGGVKITIGDGGLFAQPTQSLSNADRSYEYGSCQNISSVANTSAGLYWMSANQGKIFTFGRGMNDITGELKFWFSQYLPFKLLEDFPDFEIKDNPVMGVSCQTIFDNTNDVLYFCKKDYKLKSRYQGVMIYEGADDFSINGIPVKLGNPIYFESASFTLSYDSLQRVWISYHDWHPDFLLPSKTHFMSVKGNSIWKHNSRCDLYCNYYGIDYPFEVGFNQATGQDINTIRSLEYQLECYKYYNDCRDSHNILDENFDRLIVYNAEQISGLIKLTIKPKNSPLSIIRPTQNEAEAVSMYCSKEENKYRVNGIVDLTRDRGEFSGLERQTFITESNGYIKAINPINVNYQKSILQRKKIRHYNNQIFLRKNICGSSKLLLHLVNGKLLKSNR